MPAVTKPGRASLDRTAGGGCPHVVCGSPAFDDPPDDRWVKVLGADATRHLPFAPPCSACSNQKTNLNWNLALCLVLSDRVTCSNQVPK